MRCMRILAALCLLFVSLPRPSAASAVLLTSSDESRIAFGDWGVEHDGLPFFDFLALFVNGVDRANDWEVGPTTFVGTGGALLSKSSSGDLTTYVYDGGTFEMHFDLFNPTTSEQVEGLFTAPIIGPLTVKVHESDEEDADSVEAFYRIGPGLFETNVARALGIGLHTRGGSVDDPYLIFGTGDPTTPERAAWEGAPNVTIDVPEPGSIALLEVAGLGLIVRWRRKRGR